MLRKSLAAMFMSLFISRSGVRRRSQPRVMPTPLKKQPS